MPTYEFKGRRHETAVLISGKLRADSVAAVANSLRRDQIMPIQIVESRPPGRTRLLGRVRAKALALFTRQFAVMLGAGLPLLQCLSILTDQQQGGSFRTCLGKVHDDVESGSALADAMGRHPAVFDSLFVNMIAAGEISGTLDAILDRLSIYLEKRDKMQKAVFSASIYPAVVAVTALVIVFVIMTWVIPVFSTLFQGLNAPLPLPTLILIKLSDLTSKLDGVGVLSAVLLVAGTSLCYRTKSGRNVIDRALLEIPLLGPVMRRLILARFSRTLSTLLSSGIAILEALDITARTVGNRSVEAMILGGREEVEKGKILSAPLQQTGFLPLMAAQVISVGEETGRLDSMLLQLAEYYEEEADYSVQYLLTLLEPLLIIGLGIVIGGIVISLYLPIFTLMGHLA